MVTQEGQSTSSLTAPTKMTFTGVQEAEMDVNGDGREPLRNPGVNAVSQNNDICGKKWCCQNAETERCSLLNTGNIYSVSPGQVCASQDNNVKMGSTSDLFKPAQEHISETGTSVVEKEFERQNLWKEESDLNICYECPSPEYNHNPFALDVQTVNSHDVNTVASSKDDTTFVLPCMPPCPPLVPIPNSSTTSSKPLSDPSLFNGGAEGPRIIKHKPSSITFADYDCTSGLNQAVQESSDCGESSSEEEGDDDVFTEMTQIREFHPGCRHRRNWRRKGIGRGGREVCNGDGELRTTTGYEAEEENSSREVNAMFYISSRKIFLM